MIQIIYGLLALIDMLVYSIASSLLGLIGDLANTQFFKEEQITTIANRIYIVIGVVMLFKLVISAIQYMVNPDTFEDKEKGLAGILKKTAISIALIVLVPSVFRFLIQIQEPIIKTIPDIVLGSGTTEATDEESIGFNLSFKVLSAFIQVNPKGKNVPASAGVGKGKDIHDFPSFVEHVADGCPGLSLFGVAGKMEDCHYNYMIIISTLCGGFLVYVLLSMVLDVSIRTIKFGIIQMLAPIPISGYVFSKDRLNKFVKTATTVYVDLFIRMIIIYFIIFAIKAMLIENNLLNVLSINKGGVSDTGDWFRGVVVNIALVFGLLMFAKSAPKFISELLGLPDIGSGEMADMFKPAWQRAGGAAGALINPAANAVANWRQAKDNGEGRVARALRAIAGASRGFVDSVSGVAAGDDWSKMHSRHDAAKRKSAERSLRRVNRDKARENGQSKIDRAKQRIAELLGKKNDFVTQEDRDQAARNLADRKTQLAELANRIRTETDPNKRNELIKQYRDESALLANEAKFLQEEAVRVAADRQIQAKVDGLNVTITDAQAQIAQLQSELSDPSLTDQEVADKYAKIQELNKTISDTEGEIEKITHEKGIKEASDALSTASKDIQNCDDDLKRIEERKTESASIIAEEQRKVDEATARSQEIDVELEKYENGKPHDEQYTALVEERKQVKATIKESSDKISHTKEQVADLDKTVETIKTKREAAEKRVAEVKVELKSHTDDIANQRTKLVEQYNKYDDEIAVQQEEVRKAEEAIAAANKAIWQARFSGVNSYLGGMTPSGKGYMDLSSFLGSSRSSIYTGEAMTKMRQNADILVDENGKEITYKSKYCTIPTKEWSYAELSSLLKDVTSGKVTIDRLKELGFESSAILQSAFEDIEKKAASDYINANIAAINPSVAKNVRVRLKRPDEVNSAVVEWWDSFATELYKNGLSKPELDKLFTEFQKDPGDFIKNASAMKDYYATIGKRIVDSTKPDDGKK